MTTKDIRKCRRCADNMKSAKEHPQVVDDYMTEVCSQRFKGAGLVSYQRLNQATGG